MGPSIRPRPLRRAGPALHDDRVSATEGAPPTEAEERKRRVETLLRIEGVPVDEGLPPLPEAGALRLPPVRDVAERAMALCLIAARAEGLERTRTVEWLERFGVRGALTPEERSFLARETPTDEERVRFLRRYEAYWMLLWALGFVGSPGRPDERCDPYRAAHTLRERESDRFRAEATLREVDELLDEADLLTRYEHAVQVALSEERAPPAELEPAVVQERLHALRWLLGLPGGSPWDADGDATRDE